MTLPGLAVHASRNTPSALYPELERLFAQLLELPIAIGSGWQSPAEKHLLKMATPFSRANLLIFIAKPFRAFTLPEHLTPLYRENRLVIIEPDVQQKRIDARGVEIRDTILDDLINHHLFCYIEPGEKLARRLYQLSRRGKYLYLLDIPVHQDYIDAGGMFVDADHPEPLLDALQ